MIDIPQDIIDAAAEAWGKRVKSKGRDEDILIIARAIFAERKAPTISTFISQPHKTGDRR